jgi:hypothetical protein
MENQNSTPQTSPRFQRALLHMQMHQLCVCEMKLGYWVLLLERCSRTWTVKAHYVRWEIYVEDANWT